MQKLFGRTYDDTVGSIEKDLILKTRGEVKIQVGKKFVDLIKNGKVVRDGSNYLFKEIDSLDEMSSDGIYVCDGYVYVKIKDNIIRVCTYDEDLFVSYVDLQDTTYDQKETARRNIGLEFNNLVEALNSVKKGFVFVNDKIYYIDNGRAVEFSPGGLNVNYNISYSGGGYYNGYSTEGSGSSGEGDDSGGSSDETPSNIPEYDEMKILELNENIMITTIMFVVQNASQLQSIKNNGVFLKIIDQSDKRLDFIPEGEYIKPITSLNGDVVNVKYTDFYKGIMHEDMHVRFHHFDYITKDDFKTCIVALDENLANTLDYYILYTYGYSVDLIRATYDQDGNIIPSTQSDTPAKQTIQLSFDRSLVEETGNQDQTTIHTLQEYRIIPNNVQLDSSNFEWTFDNVPISNINNEVILYGLRDEGMHTIKVKFIGNSMYNSAEASYKLNYILNDTRQEAELNFESEEINVNTSSPQLVQTLELPEGINKSDIKWKVTTKEGKVTELTPDSSGNIVVPYQNSKEATVSAEFTGNGLYKAEVASYKINYNVEKDSLRVQVLGMGSTFGSDGEDYRNGGYVGNQNGNFAATLRFTGTGNAKNNINSYVDTINMRSDGRNGNLPWMYYRVIDDWGGVLLDYRNWTNYSGSSDSIVMSSSSVPDFKLNFSFSSEYTTNQPFMLNGGWTSKIVRIPAAGTNGEYGRILIIRNLGHFIPRYGKYYQVGQYEGGTFEDYLRERWWGTDEYRKSNTKANTGWFIRTMSEDLSYNKFIQQRINHQGVLRLDYSDYDGEGYARSFNLPEYPEITDTSFDYLPEGYDFYIEEGIDMEDEIDESNNNLMYVYPSNDRYLKYKFGVNDQDGIRDYPIRIYDTVLVHFIQENYSPHRVYYGSYSASADLDEYFERNSGHMNTSSHQELSNVPTELFSVLNSKIINNNKEKVYDRYSKNSQEYYICVPQGISFIGANTFDLIDSNYRWGDQTYKIYMKVVWDRIYDITFTKN